MPPLWLFSSYLGNDTFGDGLKEFWTVLLDWWSQPHVMAVTWAWVITFMVVVFVILALGFGPIGIGASTLAAAFQSYMYGGFTPAGGIFAGLTSLAMLGGMMPLAVFVASFIATVVASIVWKCGVGR